MNTSRSGVCKSALSIHVIAVSLIALILSFATASADPIAEFYEKKRITINVGGTSGGGYAVYARSLANVLGSYIPGGPTVIVQYMPGAGTIRAANYMYNVAPRDGTEIGAFQQPVFTAPFYEAGSIQYDAQKFQWLGSLGSDVSVCFVRSDAGVKTFEEVRQRQVTIGANAPSASSTTAPTVLNNLLSTKFKIISGYNGPDLALAIERNEVQGQCSSWSSIKSLKGEWIKNKAITVLVQLSAERDPELADVPPMMDFVKSDEEKAALNFLFTPQKFGRPYAFPPEVPRERVAALRKALFEASKDQKLIAMFEKQNLDISFTSGEDMQRLTAELFATPKAIIDMAVKASTPADSAAKN
jgi:tripartite-type tricarboxylate transporter receptor subunit TctC